MSHDPIRVRIERPLSDKEFAEGIFALIILVLILAPIAPILFGAAGVWQLLDKIGVHDVFKIISVITFLGLVFYALRTYRFMLIAYMTVVTLFYAGWAFTKGSDNIWGGVFFIIVSGIGAAMTVVLLGNLFDDDDDEPRAVDTAIRASAVVPTEDYMLSANEDSVSSEAELLAQGRFAEYHLAKAKRYLAAGEDGLAAYHAGASLAHGDLPEARQVRNAALGQ